MKRERREIPVERTKHMNGGRWGDMRRIIDWVQFVLSREAGKCT